MFLISFCPSSCLGFCLFLNFVCVVVAEDMDGVGVGGVILFFYVLAPASRSGGGNSIPVLLFSLSWAASSWGSRIELSILELGTDRCLPTNIIIIIIIFPKLVKTVDREVLRPATRKKVRSWMTEEETEEITRESNLVVFQLNCAIKIQKLSKVFTEVYASLMHRVELAGGVTVDTVVGLCKGRKPVYNLASSSWPFSDQKRKRGGGWKEWLTVSKWHSIVSECRDHLKQYIEDCKIPIIKLILFRDENSKCKEEPKRKFIGELNADK